MLGTLNILMCYSVSLSSAYVCLCFVTNKSIINLFFNINTKTSIKVEATREVSV